MGEFADYELETGLNEEFGLVDVAYSSSYHYGFTRRVRGSSPSTNKGNSPNSSLAH